MFGNSSPGLLVDIDGVDAARGPWQHSAFVPDRLPDSSPVLGPETYLAVADARAAIAALDSTARRLPNPTLLRNPTLRTEAQSTSALEGTYAPLADVLTADDDEPSSIELREIFNYVLMAQHAFAWVTDGRPITVTFLEDLQGILMRGTPIQDHSGSVRDTMVVIGRRPDADPDRPTVVNARFVPPPTGPMLSGGVQDLVDWLHTDHGATMDPVVSAALGHYQFETLHPFRDGNGRLGRLLIVLQLQTGGTLVEPTLTVSPWFEARRSEYYDALLGVSTRGDRNTWVRFFARGLQESATRTHSQMLDLVAVQADLKEQIRKSRLRADSAHSLVDFAVANPSFTVRRVQRELQVSYGRANSLVGQLVELGVLQVRESESYQRRVFAPAVLEVLTGRR